MACEYCLVCIDWLDLASRHPVRHSVDFVKEAFLKAFSERGKPEGLLFHYDRGSEYTCKEFRDLLAAMNDYQIIFNAENGKCS